MKEKKLRLKTAMKAVMLILMIGITGITNGFADELGSKANIIFADANVKSICVHYWDTNGDGELSYEEAAAVTDLDWHFQWVQHIYHFDELQYFTGLTHHNSGEFKGCYQLQSVVLPPNSFQFIPTEMFYGTALQSINFPSSVKWIESSAFRGLNGLINVDIGNYITMIKSCAFIQCTHLKSITLGSSLASLEGDAFGLCTALESITIHAVVPPTITKGDAFRDVDRSIPVYVPYGSVAAYQAADGWSEFTNIIGNLADPIPFADDNVKTLCVANWDTNGDGELSYAEVAAVTDLGEVFKSNSTITSFNELQYFTGLTSIGLNAFKSCTSLASIEMPNSVTSIGMYAFESCANLTSVVFSNSLTSIGSCAFRYCSGLITIELPNTLTTIGTSAFALCNGLTAIDIPNSVTYIGQQAFFNCDDVTTVTIGTSVTSIGQKAFGSCGNLSILNFNAENCSSLYTANDSNFWLYDCPSLATLNIGSEVQNIPAYLVNKCSGLSSVVIPNSVLSIGDYAFQYCTSLSSVVIGISVTSIGYGTFKYCSVLSSIDIPNSVTSIGGESFYQCTNLNSVSIGNSVVSIGNDAFYRCEGLTSIELPNTLTTIGTSAFALCNGLTAIDIPNSVTSIGKSALAGCSGLTTLNFNAENCASFISGGTSGHWLSSCTSLVTVNIGNEVQIIPAGFVYSCNGLTHMEIPNSVTTINAQAFNYCGNLASITIGNNVETIKGAAFANCSGLSMMMVKATAPPTLTNSNVFTGVTTTIPVYVPNGSLSAYQSADVWSDFINYQPMVDASITGYGSSTDSDHWVFIASPLASSVLPTAVDGLVADPEENYDLYRFYQSGENGEWENYKGHTAGFVLENGKGYLYANKNNVTLTFAGTMNMTASKEVELDYDGTANMSGWNLVGNPFTEAAYIDRPYYKMNATGTDVTPVETYGATPVAAYSGIVVHAETSGESVTFTKSGSKSSDNGGLQITLSKAGVRGDEAQDKVIVSYNQYAQLSKFIFNKDNAKLYIPMGGEDYAIAYSDRQSNMPLYFKTKEMGIYTMSFEGAINNIKIIDNLDGSVIDLEAEKSFTFVGTPSDRNDRFTIVFNTPATEDFAYQSSDGIVVNGEGELQVFDIMGRMVAKYYVNGVETVYIPCQSGVYMLRLLGKETKTQKIVVK